MKEITKKRLPWIIAGSVIAVLIVAGSFILGRHSVKSMGRGSERGNYSEYSTSSSSSSNDTSSKSSHRIKYDDCTLKVTGTTIDEDAKTMTVTLKLKNEGSTSVKASEIVKSISFKQDDQTLSITEGAFDSSSAIYNKEITAGSTEAFSMTVKLNDTESMITLEAVTADNQTQSMTIPVSMKALNSVHESETHESKSSSDRSESHSSEERHTSDSIRE